MRSIRRTKAILFVLVLFFGESPAILLVLGMFPEQRVLAFDTLGPIIAIAILAICNVLAAFLTFYVKVTPVTARAKVR